MNKKESGNPLFSLLHDFLKIYLPNQQKVSTNTIRSYSKSLDLLLDYIKTQNKVPLYRVTFEMLTSDTVLAFLDYLEAERGCTASTRNNRLAALRAFIEYASDRDITVTSVLCNLRKVPVKKVQNKTVEYMSMEAIAAIIEKIDVGTPKGMRDRFFIMLMYDTGARIQEMVGIKLCDLETGKAPKVTLNGKGNKTRVVPLMDKTVQHLHKYLSVFHKDVPLSSDAPLFYTITHGSMHPISDRRIRYILKQHGLKAHADCQEVPENIYPHLFRHSRAMHLYQEGMDLTMVSQWLGHAQLETTEIYAHADTEHKRKAIAASTPQDNPLYSKLNSSRYTVDDEETLKRLVGLQ